MISSFVYVGREALEMMFLTLMVTSAISMNYKIYTAAIVGILSGIIFGIFLGELLEPYEVLMYGLLSALMFYLFFTSKDLAAHVKKHVDDIAKNQSGVWVGIFTIWFIYARESMEIFVFMFQTVNNTFNGWIGAIVAAAIVFFSFPLIRKYIPTNTLFTITRYAFLVFGLWFGYEAWEHL